jgi:predicted transcriptional regulator
MRADLASAVAALISNAPFTSDVEVTPAEAHSLLAAANLVTLARTSVEYDYRGEVVDAHAPEMPTRFAKQLTQVVRGARAIGMGRTGSLGLALRCARDSVPPLRLAVLSDLTDRSSSTALEVSRRLNKPRTTVERQLKSLQMLGMLMVEEGPPPGGRTVEKYRLAEGIEPRVLHESIEILIPEMSDVAYSLKKMRYGCSDISGTELPA